MVFNFKDSYFTTKTDDWSALTKEFEKVLGKNVVSNSTPTYKIIQNQTEYVINVLVPEYKKSNFNIFTQDGFLIVNYDKKEDEQNIFKQIVSFEQRFKLSGKEDLKKIDTVLENGVLKISIGKKSEFVEKTVIDIK